MTALICRVCAWRADAVGRASLGGRYTEPADALRFQIGANATDMDTIAVTFVDVVDIAHAQLGYIPQDANHEAFRKAIGNIHTQITTISSARGELGAIQARFEHAINNLNVMAENYAATSSRIKDADMPAEAVNFMRARILSQSSNAMLTHSINNPRGVLALLNAA